MVYSKEAHQELRDEYSGILNLNKTRKQQILQYSGKAKVLRLEAEKYPEGIVKEALLLSAEEATLKSKKFTKQHYSPAHLQGALAFLRGRTFNQLKKESLYVGTGSTYLRVCFPGLDDAGFKDFMLHYKLNPDRKPFQILRRLEELTGNARLKRELKKAREKLRSTQLDLIGMSTKLKKHLFSIRSLRKQEAKAEEHVKQYHIWINGLEDQLRELDNPFLF